MKNLEDGIKFNQNGKSDFFDFCRLSLSLGLDPRTTLSQIFNFFMVRSNIYIRSGPRFSIFGPGPSWS